MWGMSTGCQAGQIRVALAGLPSMLRDIVARLVSDEADMTVVGETAECDDLAGFVNETAADALVVGMRGAGVRLVAERLLARTPKLKIVGMGRDGRSVSLYELRAHEMPVGEIAPEELMRTIRAAVRRDGGASTETPGQAERGGG